VNTTSYRKQAIERRQKLTKQLERKARRINELKVLVSMAGLIGLMLVIILISEWLQH
jgi:hypothetical protein